MTKSLMKNINSTNQKINKNGTKINEQNPFRAMLIARQPQFHRLTGARI